jgi:PHD/YefM family antitoxin component YafN of YafNO toxin-antitoxin module
VKTTSITRLRTDATRLIQELRQVAAEPVLVLQNADIAAYLVSPKLWDALQAEIKRLRKRNRELFWDGVEDAEREAERGDLTVYESADELIMALGLPADESAP